MKVNNGTPGQVRSDRTREARPVPSPAHPAAPRAGTARPERTDRVEISDAGRSRAAHLEPLAPGAANRLAEIRQRVLSGAYDADTVVASVAQRIIERGDL